MCAIGFGDDVDENKFTYDCGGSLISKVRQMNKSQNNRLIEYLTKYFRILF